MLDNVVLTVSDLLELSEARNVLILSPSGQEMVRLVFVPQWTLRVPEG